MTVYRMPTGEPFALEIREGASVQVDRLYPGGTMAMVFCDDAWWPRWGPITLIMPPEVAQQVLIQSARAVTENDQN